MARSSPSSFIFPAQFEPLPSSSSWAPQQQQQQEWRWPRGDSGGSAASSPDSCRLVSPVSSYSYSYGPCGGGEGGPLALLPLPAEPRFGQGRPGRGARLLGHGQRQSASQREKLRMRRLAQALRTLRRYLPPSLAPAGQSLTKIETLRLASRYIGHLAQLLGLRPEEEAQQQQLADHRRCPLCPPGLGCCQTRSPEVPALAASLGSRSPAQVVDAAWLYADSADAASGMGAEEALSSMLPPLPPELTAMGLSPQVRAGITAFFGPSFQPRSAAR